MRPISDNKYEILAGERRWRAARLAGLTSIPVIIKEVNNKTAVAISLIENLQRENLNAMDESRALYRLTTEFALTHQQIADLLSRSRGAVSNSLRLLNLCQAVRMMLEQGQLEMGHARCLLTLNAEDQEHTANMIIAKNLSVRDTEIWVSRLKKGSAPKKMKEPLPKNITEILPTIAKKLNTKIKIKQDSNEKGTLVIQYDSLEILERLISQLM